MGVPWTVAMIMWGFLGGLQVLVLLSGRVVYFGCPQQQAITFFTNIWQGRYPKVGDNLAEWLLELVVQADRNEEVEVAAARYADSELAKVRAMREMERCEHLAC